MRRKRYLDKFHIGKSSTVPYIENESWETRHFRRKQAALSRLPEIEELCEGILWKVRIANEGHHWIFITMNQKMVEWFPSSGKLSIGKKWDKTFHVHDVDQLKEIISLCVEEEMNDERKKPKRTLPYHGQR